ncbi:elongation factor G-like protein EF-G2 [Cryptosporangium arvum]|uniref:Translation elongation factor 2 (EF-2/EF-G) n=1 Tax=Cryptosporangium arvum DSM 44712 TaxID=927661 RepID=A0A010Z1K5_9ACTN|nr:elongation factor G-like protein EF-G2 [Cryptosporangium arvum]EXG81293.1 translation elongation factor 2 (EF-2/EF-G) [Cryptosporangium arvum DSM 44712]
MAQKVAGSPDRAGSAGPVVDDPRSLRNVVLVGHSGAGKTTLVEALLVATGTIGRAGSVVEGTTVCDVDPAAVRQQRSVTLNLAPVVHRGVKINLLDTPGYADFVGELRAGLRAADAALFVISAVDGIDASTIALWEECARVGMPRAVVVTRLDHPRADFDESVAICQRVFGDGVLPLYLPVHEAVEGAAPTPGKQSLADFLGGIDGASEQTRTAGLFGLITQQIYDYSEGTPPVLRPADPEHLELIEESRNNLIEGIIAESEDETLMDRYLAGEEIDPDVLIADLETAVSRGSFYPVLPADPSTGVGLMELLDGIVRACPPPDERPAPAVTTVDGEPYDMLTADPAGPLVAEVVKTTVDPYVGRVSLVRVFSGTLRAEQTVHVSGHGVRDGNDEHDADERAAHLYSPLGTSLREVPYAVAGDLCALTKVGTAETGDTISSRETPLLVAPWDLPEPLLPVAVVAKTRSDEDALAKNLSRLIAGDATLRMDRNPETGQLVLWTMGEAHADVVLDRLRSGGVDLDTEPVRVPLRETFGGPAKGHGRHVKQSGGHGQYAICDLEIEPLPTGGGFEFVDRVVGGAVPHQYIPSVQKGVRQQMERGLVAGFPVVDIRVTLVDGKAHSVDSSDAAFQLAGALALREAATSGAISLLEPVDEVDVTVPDNYVGPVMSDLSGRRGRVLGTEPDEHERTVVHAEVPAAELTRYSPELRSLTSGTATFTRAFARYEPMPPNLVAQALGGDS